MSDDNVTLPLALLQLARKAGLRITYLPDLYQDLSEDGTRKHIEWWIDRAAEDSGVSLPPQERKEFVEEAVRRVVPWPNAFEYIGVASPRSSLLNIALRKVAAAERALWDRSPDDVAMAGDMLNRIRIEVACLTEAAQRFRSCSTTESTTESAFVRELHERLDLLIAQLPKDKPRRWFDRWLPA